MRRRSGGITALLTLYLTIGLFGSAGAAQKTTRADAPPLDTTFRDRLGAAEKQKRASKRTAARLDAAAPDSVKRRSLAFAARGERGAAKTAAPNDGALRFDPKAHHVRLPAGKTRGDVPPFVGRNGTGLGDIFEIEQDNDDDASVLDDLPVNVVGSIEDDGDVDFFAITASGGEQIRIEVLADRIFNTSLDSFIVVLDEDDDELEANDDDFDNSHDSFIQFVPPDAGEHIYFIGIGDATGDGGDDYGYVLNITVANPPDIGEREPNDTTSTADLLHVPAVAFGSSDFTHDADVYAFQATREQTLIVDVDADILLSLMDPAVELFDGNGNFLFAADDTDGLDPRFNILLPYSGTYYLAVSNRNLGVGDGYYYSVNLSLQSAALAPHVDRFKIVDGELRRIFGSGFSRVGIGSHAEINGEPVRSSAVPKKPTTRIKVNPPQRVRSGDVVTVVNPNGRRSNPLAIE